jgi:hypothetical protein
MRLSVPCMISPQSIRFPYPSDSVLLATICRIAEFICERRFSRCRGRWPCAFCLSILSTKNHWLASWAIAIALSGAKLLPALTLKIRTEMYRHPQARDLGQDLGDVNIYLTQALIIPHQPVSAGCQLTLTVQIIAEATHVVSGVCISRALSMSSRNHFTASHIPLCSITASGAVFRPACLTISIMPRPRKSKRSSY